MKKALFVAASVVSMSLIAAPAFAAPAAPQAPAAASHGPSDVPDYPSFGDAYNTFVNGGGALGYGAASIVAGAFTGVVLTPELVAHSFEYGFGG
jgi:hypothetical protein